MPIGTGTYFGKTAELVQDAHTVSHFQRRTQDRQLPDYPRSRGDAYRRHSDLRGDAILTTLQFALV
jgi:H+-transporting ATPase